MKSLAVLIVVVLFTGSTIAADAPKKVCDASGCRIVEAPKVIAGHAVGEVKKLSQMPVKAVKGMKSSKPVRSFLRKVFSR
jgi:hypothetical protein